jgi:AmmeMemoRadiSam system protein A
MAQKLGVFVTLKKKGALRGCIGSILPSEPLVQAVQNKAIQAAKDDPRFHQVYADELKEIKIEISVLSPIKRIKNADEIVMGRDGVIIVRGDRSGVFLPQVAQETGWTKERFMSELCSQKAGLPEDAWKDAATELYTFTVYVFGEADQDKK